MLKELYIKNMAVVDDLRISFNTGFQVLTGETGAGKTILVEAIGLILGHKASHTMIRDGAAEAIVEASFDIKSNDEVLKLIKSEGVENSDHPTELVIKRQVTLSGQNKVFVNYQRIPLSLLQQLSVFLVDFTGQHEQAKLLE
ncbi:MAG: AAA family ATPase, partial [Deltaproteobacteria bacterium]|nr:AAA family ATPase [Deltaproteobacteria bacterium]